MTNTHQLWLILWIVKNNTSSWWSRRKRTPQQTASLPLDLNRTSTNPADIPQAPVDSGLASIQMRQNYDTLFPQDEIGSAISKRGIA